MVTSTALHGRFPGGMEGTPTIPSIPNVPPSFFSLLQNQEEAEDLELYQSSSANSTNYFKLRPAPNPSRLHKHSSSVQRKKGLAHSELPLQLPEATAYKYQKATLGMEILNPDGACS